MEWTPQMLMLASAFLPVLARVAGIFVFAPVLGASAVPVRLRYFLAVVLAVAVARTVAWPAAPLEAAPLLAIAAGELLVGLTIGYAARLVFLGVEVAAAHAAQQMGVGLAEVFSPSSQEAAGTVRSLFWLLAAVVFLAIGGHRMVLAAVLRTFRAVPPATLPVPADVLATVTGLLKVSFSLGLKIASPVLVAMLLTTVALGMLQRSMPQCNLLSVGLSVRALVGLVVLAASLGAMAPLLDAAVDVVTDSLSALLRAGG